MARQGLYFYLASQQLELVAGYARKISRLAGVLVT